MNMKELSEELLSVVFKHETFARKEEVGKRLIHRLNEIKFRQRRRARVLSYSVAASVAVIVAVTSFWGFNNQYQTDSTTLSVALPDQSEVELGANSFLSYNRILWLIERDVRLTGDARFKVAAGEKFTVQTALGDIRVLGTEFEVNASSEQLIVTCFEGVVEVETQTGREVLRKGDIIECTADETIFTPLPDYYEYSHTPAIEVLDKIEKVYGVTILSKEKCAHTLFDGVVTTQNLREALDVLTLSCDMSYRIENNTITMISNE